MTALPEWFDENRGQRLDRREKIARLQLAFAPRIGPLTYTRLLKTFGTAQAALAASPEKWREARCLPAAAGTARRVDGEAAWRTAEERGWSVLVLGEEGYPPLLTRTASPPLALYVKGRILEEDWWSVAVVGTRRATAYGRWQAERLTRELVAEGLTVVSGLARGIDETAHWGALNAGGRTLAVLGCGLDRVYPRENDRLAARIAENGAVISEFPPGTLPVPENFPRRNRIIAGMTLGTVVVEAGERSGALNTAWQANDAGREVFAVPGEVGRPGSPGPHLLLSLGAGLVERGDQIAEILRRPYANTPCGRRERVAPGGTAGLGRGADEALWRVLWEGPGRAEELSVRTGLPVNLVTARLVQWELEGRLQAYPDGRVAPAHR